MAALSTLDIRQAPRAPRAVHHAVVIEGQHAAIPFSFPGPAYALAKRATADGRPAYALEVYEHEGKHYSVNGIEVPLREARV